MTVTRMGFGLGSSEPFTPLDGASGGNDLVANTSKAFALPTGNSMGIVRIANELDSGRKLWIKWNAATCDPTARGGWDQQLEAGDACDSLYETYGRVRMVAIVCDQDATNGTHFQVQGIE